MQNQKVKMILSLLMKYGFHLLPRNEDYYRRLWFIFWASSLLLRTHIDNFHEWSQVLLIGLQTASVIMMHQNVSCLTSVGAELKDAHSLKSEYHLMLNRSEDMEQLELSCRDEVRITNEIGLTIFENCLPLSTKANHAIRVNTYIHQKAWARIFPTCMLK